MNNQQFQDYIGAVANHVEIRSGSNFLEREFHTWIEQFRIGGNFDSQFTIQHEAIGPANPFHSPQKKSSDKVASIISSRKSA